MFALTMLLCDSVAIIDGKLSIHGGGWITCPASLTSHGLGIIVESPSELAGATISLSLTLTEETGDPLMMFTDQGAQPLTVNQSLTLSPTGHDRVPLSSTIALTLPLVTLQPGGVYHWVATIDQAPTARWVKTFYVQD